MKKNKTMRLASVLLILTLLTTSVISGTFAKYTTTASGSDSARVAYWGFKNTSGSIELNDLFKQAYNDTVNSTTKVIAPGTENSATFQFLYEKLSDAVTAPEVEYDFTVSVAESTISNDIYSNTNIKWKLDVNGEWGTWDDLMNSILSLSGTPTNTYDQANVATHTVTKRYQEKAIPEAFKDGANTHTIYWKWAFDEADDINGFDATDLNSFDTAMGNTPTTVLIKITITATQVD